MHTNTKRKFQVPTEMQGSYFLSDEEEMNTGLTVYDIIHAVGKKSRQISRQIKVSWEWVDGGKLVTWGPTPYEESLSF